MVLLDFPISSYIHNSNYKGRFGKTTLLIYEVIMDTWSGLFNATKFVGLFTGKAFKDYLKVNHRKDHIISLYHDIVPSRADWEKIYNNRNNLYIIEGNQQSIKEIGGTYVHYKVIIELALWCDKSMRRNLFKSFIQFFNTNNYSKLLTIREKIANDLQPLYDIQNVTEKGKESEKTIFNILCELFPEEKFIMVSQQHNTADIKDGNILIEVKNSLTGDSKKNIEKLEKDMFHQKAPFAIMILCHGETSFDIFKSILFINAKDIYTYRNLLSSIFKEYKNKLSMESKYNVVKNLFNNFINEMKSLMVNEEIQEVQRMLEMESNYKQDIDNQNKQVESMEFKLKCLESYSQNYNINKIRQNIEKVSNSNRRKAKYMILFNKGEYYNLPKYLLK